jgi:hypothetical protein
MPTVIHSKASYVDRLFDVETAASRATDQALSSLAGFGTAARRSGTAAAVERLIAAAPNVDWGRAHLPVPVRRAAGSSALAEAELDDTVIGLGTTAVRLHASTVARPAQAAIWAAFLTLLGPAATGPAALAARQRARIARLRAAGGRDDSVIVELEAELASLRETATPVSFRREQATCDLGFGHELRGSGDSLAAAIEMYEEVLAHRAPRLGDEHPAVTAVSLRLASARVATTELEAAPGTGAAKVLRSALVTADRVRPTIDRVLGVASGSGLAVRRLEGLARLGLGDPERAQRIFECVLQFETTRNDAVQWDGSGDTLVLLARAMDAAGDRSGAARVARDAGERLRPQARNT